MYCGARDVGGVSQPADRNRGDDRCEHVPRHCRDHVGVAISRGDRVHGDVLARPFERQRPREPENARLGGRVIRLSELALLAVDRADVDDAAECALAHPFDHVAAHVEHRAEVRVDHFPPLLGAHAMQCRVARDAGVVDQDLDRPQIGFDAAHAGRAGLEVGNIPPVRCDRALARELRRRLVVALIHGGDPMSGLFQRQGDHPP
jgi:hypothetical protein